MITVAAVVNPFESLGKAYEQAANSIVNGSISNLISALTPVITTGLILYVVITGYMVIAGRIQDPISDILIKLCKWTIIGFIALNAGTITGGIISGFNGLESVILNGFGSDGGNVYSSLDDTLDAGLQAAAEIIDLNDQLPKWMIGRMFRNIAAASIMMLSIILQTVLAGAIIILAKSSFLVVAALAPLMLVGLFFPQTSKFADAWFNQAFNFVLTVTIAIFFQMVAVKIFTSQVDAIKAAGTGVVPWAALGQLLIIAIVNFFAVKQAPNIASGLSGGVSSASASLIGAARNAIAVGAGATAVVRHGITGNGGNNNNGKNNNGKQKHSIARRAASAAARSAGRFAGRTVSRINKGRNKVSNKN